jgi:hypothetical protein
MRSGGTPAAFQSSSASVSAGTPSAPSKTVIQSFEGSRPRFPEATGPVTNSQAKRMASALK